jgi:heme A synthase
VLGVVTLLYAVPIPLGAAHQAGALTLLASLTMLRAHKNQTATQ